MSEENEASEIIFEIFNIGEITHGQYAKFRMIQGEFRGVWKCKSQSYHDLWKVSRPSTYIAGGISREGLCLVFRPEDHSRPLTEGEVFCGMEQIS